MNASRSWRRVTSGRLRTVENEQFRQRHRGVREDVFPFAFIGARQIGHLGRLSTLTRSYRPHPYGERDFTRSDQRKVRVDATLPCRYPTNEAEAQLGFRFSCFSSGCLVLGLRLPVHKSNAMPWILEETPGQSTNRPTCVRLMSDLWAALSPAGGLQGPQGGV